MFVIFNFISNFEFNKYFPTNNKNRINQFTLKALIGTEFLKQFFSLEFFKASAITQDVFSILK